MDLTDCKDLYSAPLQPRWCGIVHAFTVFNTTPCSYITAANFGRSPACRHETGQNRALTDVLTQLVHCVDFGLKGSTNRVRDYEHLPRVLASV